VLKLSRPRFNPLAESVAVCRELTSPFKMHVLVSCMMLVLVAVYGSRPKDLKVGIYSFPA